MDIQAVELTAADGIALRGERWGGGGDWLVLLHGAGGDLDGWRPLEPLVSARRLSALALDLRGHGGSDDPWDPEACVRDVEAAFAFARREGAATVCAVAAGAGAVAALRAAPAARPDALALLSPGPLDGVERGELRGRGIAKLLVVGALESGAAEDAARVKSASIGPVLTVSFPTEKQGADLLGGEWAGQVEEQLGAFLDEQRFSAALFRPPSAGRPPPFRAVLPEDE